MEADGKTDVIIVGAGPTGLSLAAQLLRYGVDFVILDKKEGVTDLSKALAVHARTLEVYDQIGLAQAAVAGGAVVESLIMMHGGEVRTRLDLSRVGGDLSPFPFVLVFEQSKNERLLDGHLEAAGKQVLWQTALTELTQDGAVVQATLQNADGTTQTVAAKYLVGCDGASSTTRHRLGLGFEGATYPRVFYVADVEMEFGEPHDGVYLSFAADSFAVLFPMQEDRRWRLIGPLPAYEQAAREDPERDLDVSFDEVMTTFGALIQRPVQVFRKHWFSIYKVHTRHAEAFSQGRCFLAGDAAHVHTPAGGQGMNTGIQDAYNLAWKLALAVRGCAGDAVLATYSEERLANAKRLLHTTDQLFDVAAGDTWFQRLFRDHLLPNLTAFAWRLDAVKEFLFPTLSQIGIHYPDSPLSRHEGDKDFKVKAGDRMPFFRVDGAGIYDRLRDPKFHLLTFTEDGHMPPEMSLRDGFAEWMAVHALPLLPQVREKFGTDRPFSVLLRPDLHVGFISPVLSAEAVTAYFASVGITLGEG